MIAFIYKWSIPDDLVADFVMNWDELTKRNKIKYNAAGAKLYQLDDGDIISIAYWNDIIDWQRWKEEDNDHEYRTRWRPYRKFGPEKMKILLEV